MVRPRTLQTRSHVSRLDFATHSAKKPYMSVVISDSWFPRTRNTLQGRNQGSQDSLMELGLRAWRPRAAATALSPA